ncbi:hypothetical protein ACFX2I_019601 [Malus domestica]
MPASPDGDFWRLHVDGVFNYKGSRANMVLIIPHNSMLEHEITIGFKASNNKAEYEALLASLRIAKDLAVEKLAIHYDAQLITSQTTEGYKEKHPKMAQYLDKVRKQLEAFQTYTFTQVPWADNAYTDMLAGLGSALDHHLKCFIHVKYLNKPIIEAGPEAEVSQNIKEMAINLDLAEEKHDKVIMRIVAYQQQFLSSYNKRAKIRQFQPRDLVLRKAFIPTNRKGSKKIDLIWEGPYKISRVGGKGSHTLAIINDKEIEKQWNAYNLRKYHA